MTSIQEMLSAVGKHTDIHPQSFARCLESCSACLAICTACADACLSEPHSDKLRRCIRLNLDCADLCGVVVRLLGRSGETDQAALRATLEACESMCVACAAECQKHAAQYEHCGLCAEACATCARECQAALELLFEGPSA